MLTSVRTCRIILKYFFIKQHTEDGDIKLNNVPAGHMLADVQTKPFLGCLFRQIRYELSGKETFCDSSAIGFELLEKKVC